MNMATQTLVEHRPAQTIDEVIEQLNDIIAWSRREKSRLGYFAVLYRNVTANVKEGIATGRFEDGPRMEQLDVTFANRYLDAMHQFRRGQQPTRCWQASFRAASSSWPIVLQHLLLGMNAHINLDLGVASALVSPGDRLPALRRDFDEINTILSAMTDDVQDKLNNVWPYMSLCDRVGCRTDETVMNFSLRRARTAAWSVAQRLAPLSPAEMEAEIDRIDRRAAMLARLVRYPGLTASLATLVIRLCEKNNIPHIIDVLG